MKNFARDIVFLYLALLLGCWVLLANSADRWWLATTLLFAPRWLLAVPMALAVPFTLAIRPLWATAYLVHAAIIVFPIMGFQVNTQADRSANDQMSLRVITYNTGGGEVFAEAIVELVQVHKCDVLLLQECKPALSSRVFDLLNWHSRRDGLMAIGSRFPLGEIDVLERHFPDEHNAAAIACSLDIGQEKLTVVNLHLPTPRPGLASIWNEGPDGIDQLKKVIEYRQGVSETVAARVANIDGETIICGDFNMPVDSLIYRNDWGRLNNAFTLTGQGFGYTKCTRWHGVRIDHVLTSDAWQPIAAEVDESLGGDHRPVYAELVLTR